MSIESINNGGYSSYTQTAGGATKAAPAVAEPKTDDVSAAILDQDSFVKTENTKDVGYESLKAKAAKLVDQMAEQRYASLQKLVAQIFGDQADAVINAQNGLKDAMPEIMAGLENPEAASAAAAEAISENGEFGVNAVAGRIMDMAMALSDGDTAKLSLLKNAVEEGFSQAGAAWGGELPEISSKTYDEIMARFEYWETNGTLDGYVMNAPRAEAE